MSLRVFSTFFKVLTLAFIWKLGSGSASKQRSDPDPDTHQSDKKDPDAHQSDADPEYGSLLNE